MKEEYFKPLYINLTGDIRHHYDEYSVMPVHESVIRPLLENSTEAFVYRGRKDEFFLCGKMQYPIRLEDEAILIPQKGKFRFDTSMECITGHEYLWNATMWKRGSIVIVAEPDRIDFKDIFRHTHVAGFAETPNSGNMVSAVKKCKEVMAANKIAIIFPASNGIEWMHIYAQGEVWDGILKYADNESTKIY